MDNMVDVSPQRFPRTRDNRGRENREWRDLARNWREVTEDDLDDWD